MAKVLIVDDEFASRDSSRALLSLHGFQIEMAADGREAIELGIRFLPDVLIADMILGGKIDGLEVAEALQRANPKLQTLIVTGYATDDLKARVEALRCTRYLIKPVAPNEFIAAVEEAAGQCD